MDDQPVHGIRGDLERMRTFAQSFCDEAGDPEAAMRLVLNATDTRLTFSTIRGGDCGASISGFLKPERAHIMIQTALSRILRQRARDRAILASGDTGVPVWSIDIHPIAYAAIRNGGINPIFIAMLADGDMESNQLKRASTGTSIRVGTAGLIAGRASIATISGNGHPTDDAISFHEASVTRMQQMIVRDVVLPDTVLASLPGRRIGDVVSHPLLEGAENTPIRSASMSGDVLHVEFEDVRRTLYPAPGGADWLRFPWNVERD